MTSTQSTPIRTTDGTAVPLVVLHVREGYEDRRASIEAQMARLGLEFEFMLEGDMDDLDEPLLERWFSDYMKGVTPATSCATKHLLAWERAVEGGHGAMLVLEDDAVLDRRYTEIAEGMLAEITREHRFSDPWYVSLEDSGLRFVPGKERRDGQYLYPSDRGRCAGGYALSGSMARLLLDAARDGGVDEPIDWFIERALKLDHVQSFWCEPTVVEQGSHSGLFDSGIEDRRRSVFRRLRWAVKKHFRKFAYRVK